MTSTNNLFPIDPWMFGSPIENDSWYSDVFARETESALTKALQQSLFSHQPISSAVSISASVSGSDPEPETTGSKTRVKSLGVSVTKSGKRKSRASKRSMTTFIQADPGNFRQMVQQVTGVKVEGNGEMRVNRLVKPEPLRQTFIEKLQGLLPTLDTSAYLIDRQNMNTHRRLDSDSMGFSQAPAGDEGFAGTDFYSFCSFPTLESSI